MTSQTSAPDMFAPVALGHLTSANRFVRSATWEGMAAVDGSVTEKLTETLVRLAQGGVGLVIAGHAYVQKQGTGRRGSWGPHQRHAARADGPRLRPSTQRAAGLRPSWPMPGRRP